jgi:glucose-6-phosphate isomerase
MHAHEHWQHYRDALYIDDELGFALDTTDMLTDPAWMRSMQPSLARAFDAMEALEAGAIANPDEGRRVGHYWLRDASLAPDASLRALIENTLLRIERFASDVHERRVVTADGAPYRDVLVVGIGGSALGPQLVADALRSKHDRCAMHFIDNTDPDGIDRTLAAIPSLAATLTVVISKSGGTKETRNGMLEVARAYRDQGVPFAMSAVAVTGEGSELDRVAVRDGWRARFPMWDWVGGRTSETSAVGLVPAALQGLDVRALLDGARRMDLRTRVRSATANPAAKMALAWHHATQGAGRRDMVVLPYKDRLALFSRYLQQLVMESIGKEHDLDQRVVHQGLTVYGNKGSTDQHAYVQQLRDGVDHFFVTFVEVLRDREGESFEVEPGITSGDFLFGFLEGTRRALAERARRSMTLTLPEVNARSLGALIALYERTVGLYASLVHVNAYHQPGVEAGKRAAGAVLATQSRVFAALRARNGEALTCEEVARAANEDDVALVFKILRHAAANRHHGVERVGGERTLDARYRCTS